MNRLGYRDERETGIDRAADRFAYLLMSYGVLVIVAWRSFARGETAWDLLGLVIVAGGLGALYRLVNGALTRSWLAVAAVTAATSLVIGFLLLAAARP